MPNEGISYQFTEAVVRQPGQSVVRGLRATDRGTPGIERFQAEHKAYISALERAGLKVTVLEDTWLKVIIDEKDSTEYSLSSGDNLDLEAHSGYNLLIGNSGGLKITLNDKPVPISGKSGEVVTIHLP